MKIIRIGPRHHLLLALSIPALALSVSSCGRKGSPEAPPDADDPRTYPSR
jgi:predicted small lipoprotein YifL